MEDLIKKVLLYFMFFGKHSDTYCFEQYISGYNTPEDLYNAFKRYSISDICDTIWNRISIMRLKCWKEVFSALDVQVNDEKRLVVEIFNKIAGARHFSPSSQQAAISIFTNSPKIDLFLNSIKTESKPNVSIF